MIRHPIAMSWSSAEPEVEADPLLDHRFRILLVDRETEERAALAAFLRSCALQVALARNAAEMRMQVARSSFDLVVLEPRLDDEDGFAAYRHLLRDSDLPIIILSRAGTDLDRILGLEMGADDYIVKPCNPRELLARLRAFFRRRHAYQDRGRALPAAALPVSDDSYGFAGWTLDPVGRMVVEPNGRFLNLSTSEFRLLRSFVENPRMVLSREDLVRLSSNAQELPSDRSIDVQVSRLRKHLSRHQGGDGLIRTIRNEGYMFLAAVDRV